MFLAVFIISTKSLSKRPPFFNLVVLEGWVGCCVCMLYNDDESGSTAEVKVDFILLPTTPPHVLIIILYNHAL